MCGAVDRVCAWLLVRRKTILSSSTSSSDLHPSPLWPSLTTQLLKILAWDLRKNFLQYLVIYCVFPFVYFYIYFLRLDVNLEAGKSGASVGSKIS